MESCWENLLSEHMHRFLTGDPIEKYNTGQLGIKKSTSLIAIPLQGGLENRLSFLLVCISGWHVHACVCGPCSLCPESFPGGQ